MSKYKHTYIGDECGGGGFGGSGVDKVLMICIHA